MKKRKRQVTPKFKPEVVIVLMERAAKAVESLIDDRCGDTEKRLIKICALAVRGESLASCEELGPEALEMFKLFYMNDSDIDTSDIPEVRDFSKAIRGHWDQSLLNGDPDFKTTAAVNAKPRPSSKSKQA